MPLLSSAISEKRIFLQHFYKRIQELASDFNGALVIKKFKSHLIKIPDKFKGKNNFFYKTSLFEQLATNSCTSRTRSSLF